LISCFDNGLDFQIVVWKALLALLSPYSIRRGCGYTVSFWEIPQYRSIFQNLYRKEVLLP
ncbi:hypothetical protein EFM1CSP_19660, partial [Enterococcus faecium]